MRGRCAWNFRASECNFRASERRAELVRAMPSAAENLEEEALRHWTGSLTISTGVLPSRQIFLKLPSVAEKNKCNHCISEIRGLKSKTSPNLCKIGTFYRDAPKERVTKTLFPPYFDRFSRKIVNFYVILLAETYIAKRDQEARTYISFPFIYCGGISAAKLRCGEMEARNAADGIPAKRPPFRVQPRRGAF